MAISGGTAGRAVMAGAGALNRRYHFQKRQEQDDGFGNTVSDWVLQFTTAAAAKFLRGGESVMASRLEAKAPVILTIRTSAQARGITADWRAVDARTDEVFNIRENPRETDDHAYLEFLAESGPADG